MASNAGAITSEAPPSSHPTPATLSAEESVRLLKRQREESPSSPNSHSFGTLEYGSPTKAARLALASGQSPPPPLTGAAALEDNRRRRQADQRAGTPPSSSENPSHRVLASLMSAGTEVMSRPQDAPHPVPTANMDAASQRPVHSLTISSDISDRMEDHGDTSPQSTDGMGGVPVTASPIPMDVDKGDILSQQIAGQEERNQPSSLSYPGSLQSTGSIGDIPSRGMSYPVPSGPGSLTPHSTKKYKCPYCNTEFTRHHNLKSHLLTHSQEKPYVCTECPLRFRRLHDLKRHGKLHSGEKPHICPKCDRKFARGDALARHSKGAGGCAGRRSSMGSFADGDELDASGMGDGDDSTMSGIGYEHGDDEELMRRQTMPTVATHHVGSQDSYVANSRTYPPAMNRPAGSGLYPPNVTQTQSNSAASTSVPTSMASNHTPNTSISSAPISAGNAGLYSQTGMTESPKPLSPGIAGHDPNAAVRQRSPGLSQHQQLGRRQSDLQSPHGSNQVQAKLPGLSHPGAQGANPPGVTTHGRTPSGTQGSNDSRNMFAQSDPSVWAYVQALEEKVKQLSDQMDEKVRLLSDQVSLLNHQVVRLEQKQTAPELLSGP